MAFSSAQLVLAKTSDFLLYADDTDVEYNDISEILHKLQTYKETDEPENFIVNWGKVFVLVTTKDKNKYVEHTGRVIKISQLS